MSGRFHSRGGFYFERTSDSGDVTITFEDPHTARGWEGWDVSGGQVVLHENEWASVVASVSARGENAETWQEARDYHSAEPNTEDTGKEETP